MVRYFIHTVRRCLSLFVYDQIWWSRLTHGARAQALRAPFPPVGNGQDRWSRRRPIEAGEGEGWVVVRGRARGVGWVGGG